MNDDGPNYCVCCQLDCRCQDLSEEMFEDMLNKKIIATIDLRRESCYLPFHGKIDMSNLDKRRGIPIRYSEEVIRKDPYGKIMSDWNSSSTNMHQINVDLTEEELDKMLDEMKVTWNGILQDMKRSSQDREEPTQKIETDRQARKRLGLCVECGDKGEFIAGGCMCRNGHGKIFGKGKGRGLTMSGFNRKLKREALKREYKKFARTWADEKAYQRYVIAKDGELPEGQPQLGQKPTFVQWQELRAKASKLPPKTVIPDDTAVQDQTISDLDWDEEENVTG